MLTWIAKFAGKLPIFGNLFEKLLGDDKSNAEAEKIKAEAELADIKGFHKTGRISAKHFLSYTKSVALILLFVLFGIALFHPTAATNFDTIWGSFIGGIKQLFEVNL